ncbi:MAG: phosphatidate cytidylyltransferase [Bifidobacteriaceae bacterium]|jgi:phosphatidate cytidylyltransferase|nr:phosphatidate cytidylyltransferase [Bifidobacteriaceae bacterium]
MKISKLGWRFITGIGLYLVLVTSLYFSDWPFLVMLILVLVIAQFEFWQAFKSQGHETPLISIEIATAAMVVGGYLFDWWGMLIGYGIGLLFTGVWMIYVFKFEPPAETKKAGVNYVLGAFALFYISALASTLALIIRTDAGNWKALIAISLPLVADIGAYGVGKAIGRNKLIPAVSPNKTVEGTLGGALLVALASFIFIGILLPAQMNWWKPLLLALIAFTFGTLGDLFESFIKRRLGLKDFSDLLWGHGGFLDRIDSVILTAPAMLLIFSLL